MLRIGARTCVLGLDDDIDAALSAHEAPPRAFLIPAFGAAAAGPDIRAVRTRLELAQHSHSSVAATLDRFGGTSWLTEAEVHDFQHWPLELYKLTLAPPPPELAGHIAIVTGAASGIGREVAHDLAGRGAHLVLADLDGDGLEQTCEGLDRAVRVTGDLTEAQRRRRARPHRGCELRRHRFSRLQRRRGLDRGAGASCRRPNGGEASTRT